MSDSSPDDGSTVLRLNADESLVLFEFLHRFSQADSLTIEHPAESQALWNLCCLLERQSKGSSNDYAADLATARERLADGVT